MHDTQKELISSMPFTIKTSIISFHNLLLDSPVLLDDILQTHQTPWVDYILQEETDNKKAIREKEKGAAKLL